MMVSSAIPKLFIFLSRVKYTLFPSLLNAFLKPLFYTFLASLFQAFFLCGVNAVLDVAIGIDALLVSF